MKILNTRGDNRKPGITWGQWIENQDCPYLRRWVFNFGIGSIRVHHWFSGDDPRYLHDHPWWFLTFVVKGGYTDVTQKSPFPEAVYVGTDEPRLRDVLRAPAVRFRHSYHAHTVADVLPGTWTVLLTGKPLRDWGFYTEKGWMRMRKFFRTYGHHPCE